jgi:hypothetical protein
MKSASIRYCPSGFWRFLALEEEDALSFLISCPDLRFFSAPLRESHRNRRARRLSAVRANPTIKICKIPEWLRLCSFVAKKSKVEDGEGFARCHPQYHLFGRLVAL